MFKRIQNTIDLKKSGVFDKNTKLYMTFLIPLLLILVFLLYKNTFTKKNFDKLEELDYKKKIELKELPKCQSLPDELQYKLVDYYIASSYNTPCIEDQHYDYVSDDIIISALNSGARFIQIPICQQEVYYESPPVIGTAEKGKTLITSLNTLDVVSTFNNILSYAFKHKGQKLNYPLFIQLVLHTKSTHTLNILHDIIVSVFKDLILKPDKYYKYPIGLEKLCKLLNRVVFFCSDNYQESKLKNIIIPTDNLYQELHFDELGKFNVTEDKFYTNDYHKMLSEKEQERSHQLFTELYPNLESLITENKNNKNNNNNDKNRNIGDEILMNEDILNNLSTFNKVGLTLVYPHRPEDVNTKNYEFKEALTYGCQFICMNYQNPDKNIYNYIDIFKETSFRLKPSGLRFTELQISLPDIEMVYNKVSDNISESNIDVSFINKYLNNLVSIESYTYPNYYLTIVGENLKFIKKDDNNKLTNKQCFILKETELGEDVKSFHIESIDTQNKNKVISLSNLHNDNDNNHIYILNNLSTKFSKLKNQSFYALNSSNGDNNFNTFKLVIDTKSNNYIGLYNKFLKNYKNINEPELKNNTSFKISNINHQKVITFITLTNKALYGFNSGVVNLVDTQTNSLETNMSRYIMIPVLQTSKVNVVGVEFYLKNSDNNKFLSYNSSRMLIETNQQMEDLNKTNVFVLNIKNGFYQIKNDINMILNYEDNFVKFQTSKNTKNSTSFFKINLDYLII